MRKALVVKAIKALELSKKIGWGTSVNLQAMVSGLGLDGARKMLASVKQENAIFLSPAECDGMNAILDQAVQKAQLNSEEVKAQTVFADAKLKSGPNTSVDSSASSVSLDNKI